ncbi:hypothetical protein D0Y65_004399, partial [Glycine soja]
SIASSADPNVVIEVLNLLLSDAIPDQDIIYVLAGISNEGSETVWRWLKLMAQILLHGTLHATIYEVDKLKIGGGNNLTKIFEARETLEQRVVDAAVPGDQKGSKFFGVLHFEEFIRHLRLKVSNIMYLDSLAGVGLSYSKNTSKYATWDLETRLIPMFSS